MKICHLSVKNYRGIKNLDWYVEKDINCLVGAGDSTKSTILSAIYYVFFPTWNPIFRDCDFYNQDTSQPIEIIATIRDFPTAIRTKYSSFLRGLRSQQIVDEPTDSDIPVLSIRLHVNENLEAIWTLFTEREFQTPQYISAAERKSFGVFRLGGVYDADFSWSKGSALDRMSDQDIALREAMRSLKNFSSFDSTSELQKVSSDVQAASVPMGINATTGFRPAFDITTLDDNRSIIALQDGDVPLRLKGKGTKRLIAMAMQKTLSNVNGVLTIDEVETGLEPYRLRHLIRSLQDAVQQGETSQVFATTHSDVAVVEFEVGEIAYVSRDATGNVTISNLPDDAPIQKLIRTHNEAVLSRKIIVCEGKTEQGFCQGLDRYWCRNNHDFFALYGVVPTAANGVDDAATNGIALKKIGYLTALFIDGNVSPGNPSKDEISKNGVNIFQWSDCMCTEQIVFAHIDMDNYKGLIKAAIKMQSIEGVLADISNEITRSGSLLNIPTSESDLMNLTLDSNVRTLIGDAANRGSWYKTMDGGMVLGYYVAKSMPNITTSPLYLFVTGLLDWAKS